MTRRSSRRVPKKSMLKKLFHRTKKTIPVDVLTGYAHWAKSYPPQAHNPLMRLEEQAMLNLLPDNLTGKSCLDLACGTGRYLMCLQTRRAGLAVGVDYSADMLGQSINNTQRALSYQLTINNLRLVRAPFFPLAILFGYFRCNCLRVGCGTRKRLNSNTG